MSDGSGSNGNDRSDCFRQFEERVVEGDYIDALDAAVDLVACIKARIWDEDASGGSDGDHPRIAPLSPEQNFTRNCLTMNEAPLGHRTVVVLPWLLPLALLLVVVVVTLIPWAPEHF